MTSRTRPVRRLKINGPAPRTCEGEERRPGRATRYQSVARLVPVITASTGAVGSPSAMTSGYYRTSSPVTALPMIMRWISDVPSKIVKLVEVGAVSAGRWLATVALSARTQHGICRCVRSGMAAARQDCRPSSD
jgi:hypothetical protein